MAKKIMGWKTSKSNRKVDATKPAMAKKDTKLATKPTVKKESKPKRSKFAMSQDSQIKAKKPGWRTAANGNEYYEARPNRSDVNRKKKPYLKHGGPVEGVVKGEWYNIYDPGMDTWNEWEYIGYTPGYHTFREEAPMGNGTEIKLNDDDLKNHFEEKLIKNSYRKGGGVGKLKRKKFLLYTNPNNITNKAYVALGDDIKSVMQSSRAYPGSYTILYTAMGTNEDLQKAKEMFSNYSFTNDKTIMKDGGSVGGDDDFENDYKKVKQHIKEGYGNIDSDYIETTWENMSDIAYSTIEDKLVKRLQKDKLFNYEKESMRKGGKAEGGEIKMAKKDLDKYKYYLSKEEALSNAYDEAESEDGEDSIDAKVAWEDLGSHLKSMRTFEQDMIKQYGKDFYKQYDSYVFGKMKEGGNVDKSHSKGKEVENVNSNINMSWNSTKKIADDIRSFIFDSYEAAGEELADDVIAAINNGIELAKMDMGSYRMKSLPSYDYKEVNKAMKNIHENISVALFLAEKLIKNGIKDPEDISIIAINLEKAESDMEYVRGKEAYIK